MCKSLHTTSGSEAGVFDSNERSEWPTWKHVLLEKGKKKTLGCEIGSAFMLATA